VYHGSSTAVKTDLEFAQSREFAGCELVFELVLSWFFLYGTPKGLQARAHAHNRGLYQSGQPLTVQFSLIIKPAAAAAAAFATPAANHFCIPPGAQGLGLLAASWFKGTLEDLLALTVAGLASLVNYPPNYSALIMKDAAAAAAAVPQCTAKT
jgi:hypothetical protein